VTAGRVSVLLSARARWRVCRRAQPRLLGPGRVIGGLLALAAAIPPFTVSATTTPETAAATSELNAIFLVVAAAFLGPIVPYVVARLLAPLLTAFSPVGGFLASANLGAATRRFSSASTPLVLTVALSRTLFFSGSALRIRRGCRVHVPGTQCRLA
jgi:putative ABC transport system permease protein